jgi:YaiO family outer membrane protein
MIYSIITQLIAHKMLKRNLFLSAFAFSMLTASQLSAQSADSLYKQGRELAYRNQFDSALIFLHLACAAQPRDMDMRLTLARVYAWKKDYPNAEMNMAVVTSNQPHNREALAVLADIYLWSKNWPELDNITQKALNPLNATSTMTGVKDSVIFIQKYAAGLIEQKMYREAVNAMKPFRVELKKLWDIAIKKLRYNTLSVYAGYYDFKTAQTDWQTAAVEYIRRQKRATYVGTLNYAHRFGKQGTQWLLQAYPKIGKQAYAQLIFGYSEGKVFPNLTYGGSFFAGVAKRWEIEAGMRIYQVNTPQLAIKVERATVLRGGLSYQNRQHRMAYTVSKVSGISTSGFAHTLSYRHYLKDAESYFQLAIGTGTNINNQISPQFDNFALNSKVVSLTLNRWINDRWRVMGNTAWEQNKTKDGIKQNRMTYDLGVGYRF